MMKEAEARKIAVYFMEYCKDLRGDKFKAGALEAITNCLIQGNGAIDRMEKLADSYIIGKTLNMPWGNEVSIHG